VWENITPPQVNLDPNFQTRRRGNYGINQVVIDPHDTATVYIGDARKGSTRQQTGGASWTHG